MPGKRSNGEGTLRKRPNGLWECTMMVGYQEDGRRRYKSFYGKTQKEAKDKAEAYKRDTADGLYIDPNLTFQEWAQKWYEGYRDSVSPTTYESYGYTLKILVGAFGPRKLGSIKPLDVEQFLKGLRADGKSDSYLTKCRGMLYQIMHKAEANDLIRKNPVRFAEKMKAHKPVKRKEAFTQEEVKILMEQLPDNKVGHTIRLMLATGMRTQEVLALEPQHIEPDGPISAHPRPSTASGTCLYRPVCGPALCSSGNRPGNSCGIARSPANLSIPVTSGINTETPCSAFRASVC